jgi:hypothetical protein
MYTAEVARQLRRRGHDVTAVRDDPHLIGSTDAGVLAVAQTQRRAVVTEDIGGFVGLDRAVRSRGRVHYGIVLAPARRFPRTGLGIGAFVRALDSLLSEQRREDALLARIHWLRP